MPSHDIVRPWFLTEAEMHPDGVAKTRPTALPLPAAAIFRTTEDAEVKEVNVLYAGHGIKNCSLGRFTVQPP